MNDRPISEDDLQAYVDGSLDIVRADAVRLYLDTHPQQRRRVESFRDQRDRLRARMAPIADEPIPSALNIAHLLEARRFRRRSWATQPWAQAAAAVALLVSGGTGGFLLRGTSNAFPAAGIASLAAEARASYVVYAPDRTRPVELGPEAGAPLVDWASHRLNRPLQLPDLSASGFHYMGGRLVVTPHGPAVLYMFDNRDGIRLVMLTRKMAIDRNTPMTSQVAERLSSVSWSRDGLGFSLTGPVAPGNLHEIADRARGQLQPTT